MTERPRQSSANAKEVPGQPDTSLGAECDQNLAFVP